jgi:hypothetical protein
MVPASHYYFPAQFWSLLATSPGARIERKLCSVRTTNNVGADERGFGRNSLSKRLFLISDPCLAYQSRGDRRCPGSAKGACGASQIRGFVAWYARSPCPIPRVGDPEGADHKVAPNFAAIRTQPVAIHGLRHEDFGERSKSSSGRRISMGPIARPNGGTNASTSRQSISHPSQTAIWRNDDSLPRARFAFRLPCRN